LFKSQLAKLHSDSNSSSNEEEQNDEDKASLDESSDQKIRVLTEEITTNDVLCGQGRKGERKVSQTGSTKNTRLHGGMLDEKKAKHCN
jgi:hypothetical protein